MPSLDNRDDRKASSSMRLAGILRKRSSPTDVLRNSSHASPLRDATFSRGHAASAVRFEQRRDLFRWQLRKFAQSLATVSVGKPLSDEVNCHPDDCRSCKREDDIPADGLRHPRWRRRLVEVVERIERAAHILLLSVIFPNR